MFQFQARHSQLVARDLKLHIPPRFSVVLFISVVGYWLISRPITQFLKVGKRLALRADKLRRLLVTIHNFSLASNRLLRATQKPVVLARPFQLCCGEVRFHGCSMAEHHS